MRKEKDAYKLTDDRKPIRAFEKPKAHDEWIYGLNPVLEAVRSGRTVNKVFLSTSRREKAFDIEKELLSSGMKIQRVEPRFFEERFPKGHQGIAAVVAPRKYSGIDDLMEIPLNKKQVPLFIVLDCIEDPRNFGAILRVADAAGVHGAVIQSHRSASLGPGAVKASAGASEFVPIARVPNIKNALRNMKDEGLTIVGAEAEADRFLWQADFTGPVVIVIGSEGKGMRKTVGDICDFFVKIPMAGAVSSLNASVAAGIILFEVMRQRKALATYPA